MRARPSVLIVALLAGGCWLPVGTAAPQSATTVGKGEFGFTMHGEAPTIDLLATQTDDDVDRDDYALMPWPTFNMQLAYGLDEALDLEVGVDGTLLIVLPVLYGAHAGLRIQLLHTEAFAVAAAGRVGYLGLGVSEEGQEGDSQVSASYGAATLTAQMRDLGAFRPGIAFTAIPTSVRNDVVDEAAERFFAFAGSATGTLTFAIGVAEIGPFLNVAYFRSPNLRGSSTFLTGGLMFGIRSQKDPPSMASPVPPPAGTR